MNTLKGQNLRILKQVSANKYQVYAKAVNCTITINNETEDSSTKDNVSMFTSASSVRRSWQMQVESLDVTDAATLLADIKAGTLFKVMFDKTANTNNQTGQKDVLAHYGNAYITDVTFTWNDRENAVKNITLAGTGKLHEVANMSTAPTFQLVTVDNVYSKGQYTRLFVSDSLEQINTHIIGAAKQLSLHVAVQTENTTTKDTESDFDEVEPVSISYDITTNALVSTDESIISSVIGVGVASMIDYVNDGDVIRWAIFTTSGANNRTPGTSIASGEAIVTQLTINAQNRQTSTWTANLLGVGEYA